MSTGGEAGQRPGGEVGQPPGGEVGARPAPPAGEEIHLPGPTILPFVAAIAITLMVVGTTLSWYITGFGGVVLIVVVIRWIADTRRDVAALPEEHR